MERLRTLSNKNIMIEAIQKSVGGYMKPTPSFYRRIGDSLLAISTFVVGFGIATDHDWIGYTALGIGVVGKFLTNFFTE